MSLNIKDAGEDVFFRKVRKLHTWELHSKQSVVETKGEDYALTGT